MKRRNFLRSSLVSSLGVVVSSKIVFAANIPDNYTPLLLQGSNPFKLFDKDAEMTVLNERPWNIEAKAHLLNDAVTPNKYMFIRNNGLIPQNVDQKDWKLTVDGESVKESKIYSLTELKEKFTHHTYQLVLECGGNGRAEFDPPAKGNQWTIGAVSCANWTGIRLSDLLNDVGIKKDAVYIGYHGSDIHLSKNPSKEPISRGIPIAKAFQDETLLAFKMNGEAIPLAHGYPLRLVAGGWPASASGKWVNRLSVRNIVHDGPKMQGKAYRVPRNPVEPGANVADKDMRIIESMPVKSLITYPRSGAILARKRTLEIRGHAWAGELEVSSVHYSIDFGATWSKCTLLKAKNRLAWQHFNAQIKFPQAGYYEVWAKATDTENKSQPIIVPGWNPKGYLNNACHRIAVKVE